MLMEINKAKHNRYDLIILSYKMEELLQENEQLQEMATAYFQEMQ